MTMAAILGAFTAMLLGFVAGAWLAPAETGEPSAPWLAVRAIAGLLLLTIAFFLSLVFALPWFIGPALVLGSALLRHRRRALVISRPPLGISLDGVAAALLGSILLAPIVISAGRMVPGDVPPVFFNVDTPTHSNRCTRLRRRRRIPRRR